jgi:hypothetical protein
MFCRVFDIARLRPQSHRAFFGKRPEPFTFTGIKDFPRRAVSSASGHEQRMGTMRWNITLDQDDLTLAIATIVSAVGITLALI